ncbi:DNA primase [Nocardia sp. alder85J]|uniref:DNA primase n=1 Tax=Nocardia sp. alder85J TaxID=2862949 RepID=UPI001CD61E08|nr:DNA primase [Nocardia sp. alder85J]MCX4097707.1 DNA primase [Nocardia sp. alder85J]
MNQPKRIPDQEIATVRELARLEEIVGSYLTLRPAGADSLKGLCPFHDEKTPSFHVRPSRGLFHCFGCGESGDVFAFLQRHEQIGFREAVELVADRVGHRLRYEGGGPSAAAARNTRARLLAANTAAAQFYQRQLATDDAATARQYLAERNFDSTLAETFGCGFAPTGWDTLTKHLLQQGFTGQELEAAGLSRPGRRGGMLDRFRGRLVWPIRSRADEVLGFGARRLFADDPITAKYLNTPETLLYKKSHVLFGLDHAKRRIAATHQVVVVEGYTDVMAMHAAGITTAVASCGTAFGEHHLGVLRRMLLDDSAWRAEIIYAFDGDAAGIAAAGKAFGHAVAMPGRSSVAIASNDRDPCDLRRYEGDTALHELIGARQPLIEFVLRSAVGEFDLSEVTGRVAATGRARALLDRIQDPVARGEYGRQVARWCGVEPNAVLGGGPVETNQRSRPDADTANVPDGQQLERKALHAALHHASLAAANGFDAVPAEAFHHPEHRRLREAIADSGGATAAAQDPSGWVTRLIARLAGDTRLVGELIVTPFPVAKSDASAYIAAVISGLSSTGRSDSAPSPAGAPMAERSRPRRPISNPGSSTAHRPRR